MSSSTLAHTTLPLPDPGCGGGGAHAAECELARVSGVSRVYVSPLTEMAYVEYDATRCSPTELAAALRRGSRG